MAAVHSHSCRAQDLIGNILSVVLLTWLVMPLVSRIFDYWLNSAGNWKTEIVGAGTIIGGVAILVVLFRVVQLAL